MDMPHLCGFGAMACAGVRVCACWILTGCACGGRAVWLRVRMAGQSYGRWVKMTHADAPADEQDCTGNLINTASAAGWWYRNAAGVCLLREPVTEAAGDGAAGGAG